MNEFFEFLKYVILGLVQGFTEPLPISSSGHMLIFDSIFGKVLTEAAMNNFQIVVNFASLIAIMFYYRNLLKELVVGSWNFIFKKQQEDKSKFVYAVLILIASIPAGIAGLTIKIFSLEVYFTNILFVGICLFITGNLLLFIHHAAKDATRDEVTWKDSLYMGFGQIIALLPGISRSGMTSSVGVANKLSLEKALRFSFMMYIPASIAAALVGFVDIYQSNELMRGDYVTISGYIGAFFASLIATYIAINLFFKLVKNKNLKYFGYYCISVSVIVLGLILFGVFKW